MKMNHITPNITEPKPDPKEEDRVIKVMQFNLELDDELYDYERILNTPDCKVVKEHLSFSQKGKTLVTLWWSEPVQK